MQGTDVHQLSKGDWVFHPRMPDWGYGKVLELIGNNKGRVFFLLAGEKKMSWEHAGLDLVEGDKASQAALNDQLVECNRNLAKDLLTSEELSQGVICTPCDSSSSRCGLCKCASDSLRVYSCATKGKMCLCDRCRDKIMLETKGRAEINQSITEMEKRSRKVAADADKDKKKKKLKTVKKS
jgi:hypothetical protein